jgi:Trypsin
MTLQMNKTSTVGVLTILIANNFAFGQTAKPDAASQAVHFSSIGELTQAVGAQVTLRGAALADPAEWPASFYSLHPGGSCTSTLVGPRTLVTAAHCAASGSTVVINMSNKEYKGSCTQSGIYTSSHLDKDWSLCLMEPGIPTITYETINSNASLLKINTNVLLAGFGCVNDDGTGGNDNNYRLGDATITRLPTSKDDDIITSGPASLCFGDSGGGAFLFLDVAKKKRVQISVNSRVGRAPDGTLLKTSYLAALSAPDAMAFLKKWAAKNGAAICGVTAGATNCR